jgi:hypothetical protein
MVITGGLFADLVFRNVFGPAAPVRSEAGAWRVVLTVAYVLVLVLIARLDSMGSRTKVRAARGGGAP